jgi:cell division protein FtsI (penicillin-binding protein 3)
VGTIKIALDLGAPRFYDAIRQFGVGQLTGIELPGENRGVLRPLENWTASSIGSVAIGQEISVTPVQIISAVSAIANGGTLYRSHIVQEIRGDAPVALPARPESEQVTDPRTAATVREMMESVLLDGGTGKPAALNGYTAAGKSGTAQKIDPHTGRYSPTDYVASFVGFAPVNEPAVTILVVLDSPVGQHMGGNLGGPVFKRIAEQVLAYLDVAHDVPMTAPAGTETAKNGQPTPTPGADKFRADANQAAAKHEAANQENVARFRDVVAKKDQAENRAANQEANGGAPTIAFSEEDAVDVPDFSGQSVRGVTEACSRLGLIPSLLGSGVALEQSPEAGTRVIRGSTVTVRFGRAAATTQPPTLAGSTQRNVH